MQVCHYGKCYKGGNVSYTYIQDVPKQTNSTDCGVFISQVMPSSTCIPVKCV